MTLRDLTRCRLLVTRRVVLKTAARQAVPGDCGCGTTDVDTDGDCTLDCNEACDTDPAKLGACGPAALCGRHSLATRAVCSRSYGRDVGACGHADHIEPGVCGCNTADVDSDSDGTADCNDACPSDSGKIGTPGAPPCTARAVSLRCSGAHDCSATHVWCTRAAAWCRVQRRASAAAELRTRTRTATALRTVSTSAPATRSRPVRSAPHVSAWRVCSACAQAEAGTLCPANIRGSARVCARATRAEQRPARVAAETARRTRTRTGRRIAWTRVLRIR